MNARPYVIGLLAFFVVVLTLAVGSMALAKGYDANQRDFSEQDTVTIDFQTNSTVDTDDVPVAFYDDETITTASGESLSEGQDYEWNTTNGEIEWFNTSSTTSGESATVDFRYRGHTQAAASTHSIAVELMTVLPYLGLVVLTIGGMGGLAVFVGKIGRQSRQRGL